ncbi:hypothetical protein, partial [Moraxella lacunata]|uniref:hypothetical protein n=1 Tax=Moraxella lacunata TaxID=477 RepID=UPI000AF01269
NLTKWQDVKTDNQTIYTLKVDNSFGKKASNINILKISVTEDKDNEQVIFIKNQKVKISETNIDYKTGGIIYYQIDNINLKATIDSYPKQYYHLSSARAVDNDKNIFFDTPHHYNAKKDKSIYFLTLSICGILTFIISTALIYSKKSSQDYLHRIIDKIMIIFNFAILSLLMFHIIRIISWN